MLRARPGSIEMLLFPTDDFNQFTGVGSRDEERLVRDLFRGYNKLIRPVQNMTQKVQVAFGLAFIQLINVVSSSVHAYYQYLWPRELHISCFQNEKNQIMKSNVWLRLVSRNLREMHLFPI